MSENASNGTEVRKRAAADALGSLELQIARAIKGLRFGSVEIVFHDGHVVQIERREKMRLSEPATLAGSDGFRAAFKSY